MRKELKTIRGYAFGEVASALQKAIRRADARLAAPARDLLLAMWKSETGDEPDRLMVEQIVLESVQGGQISLRRAAQMLGAALLERSEGAKP